MTFRDKIMRVALFIPCLAFCSIIFRYSVLHGVVGGLHITEGAAIEFILGGTPYLKEWQAKANGNTEGDKSYKKVDINWSAQYPYDYDDNKVVAPKKTPKDKTNGGGSERIDKLMNFLPFKQDVPVWQNRINQLIAVEGTARTGGFPVKEIENGYFGTCFPKKTDEFLQYYADKTAELARFCSKQGSKFLYVQAPIKICHQDKKLDRIYDFSNDNTDVFLQKLAEQDISYIDFRSELLSEYKHSYEAFFKTDHHWLPKTGLWATRIIVNRFNHEYGMDMDVSLLQSDNFTVDRRKNCYLGSEGRAVTLARAKLEDIDLFYPREATYFHIMIPSISVDKEGDFSVIYDMTPFDNSDPYTAGLYSAYMYGDMPLIQLINKSRPDGKKILVIKDSFAEVVTPFLALEAGEVDVIDVRSFTGSVKSYIMQTKPDVVMVLYYPGEFSYENMYNFR